MMSLLKRLGTLLGVPGDYVPNPEGSVSVTAREMYQAAAEAKNPWRWSDHHLIQVGTHRLDQLPHGHWPRVASVDYLEDGEGGEPTVYLAAGNEEEVWPLHPQDFVVLLPPHNA
jgi:hypothetical protein